MDRAGITAEQARKRFRGTTTDIDVQVARQLLVHAEQAGVASIPQDMSASVRVHVGKLFSADPAIREQAAETLGRLGAEALPAVPFLAENLLDRSYRQAAPGQRRARASRRALETAEQTLQRLGLPGLTPLMESLRNQVAPTTPSDAAPSADGGAAKSAPASEVPIRTAAGIVSETLGGSVDWPAHQRPRHACASGPPGCWVRPAIQRALEPLVKLLEDDDQQVRTTAAHALQTLTDQDFGTDANKWREWLQTRQ